MGQWISYVVVTVIAASIVLAATSAKSRVDELAVATIQARSGKKVTLDVAALLERDIRNIGSNFPAYELDPDSAMLDWKTDSTVNHFQYIGQAAPGQPPVVIRYEWRAVDTANVHGVDKPLYRISRFLDGNLYAHTPATFTGVNFAFLNDGGQPAASPDLVRQIAIELKAISTLGSSRVAQETRWNAVYRPQAIAREDNEDV